MKRVRTHFQLEGRLQGVGFRPFIYRIAHKFNLVGWVRNTIQGVEIEIQGLSSSVEQFERSLYCDLPSHAQIRHLKKWEIDIENSSYFQILLSKSKGLPHAEILPDFAICSSCLSEIFDVTNRRYGYPFTQCTYCGPRYSILKRLPYDRDNTTMDPFRMCESCLKEYHNPLDRRFHAQGNCCPDCGPTLKLKDFRGNNLGDPDLTFKLAAESNRAGSIVAVQGVGGFHLFCDATNDEVILRLRNVKGRKSKPLAVMVRDLQVARELCWISLFEEKMICGAGAPIVLLQKKLENCFKISKQIAPGISSIGVMLPYTALHALLMNEFNGIVVVTSGNVSDEPLCYEVKDAFLRLQGIADYFLVHDRLIACPIDDSVVREVAGTEVVFRAGRGYTPLVVEVDVKMSAQKKTVIGLGAHQKNTIALGDQGRILLMPHIGDLDTVKSTDTYLNSLKRLLDFHCINDLSHSLVLGDLHPDYHTTKIGHDLASSFQQLQHHVAHLFSCIAEHQITGPVFGVTWDGTGYGWDGMIWGGEFFHLEEGRLSRIGSLRQFPLPGGSKAIRETRRSALGVLYAILGKDCIKEAEGLGFEKSELNMIVKALSMNINSPLTSSCGRLFDAVAALVGIRTFVEYEGQSAAELEGAVHASFHIKPYSTRIVNETFAVIDWEPLILEILNDRKSGLPVNQIAARFHLTLVQYIVKMARHVGLKQVVLSGGCFQNRVLCEWAVSSLREEGFCAYWNQMVPPNDGGISVGQVMGGFGEIGFVSKKSRN